jgi:tetratricopeptide (TPR) repeat protein
MDRATSYFRRAGDVCRWAVVLWVGVWLLGCASSSGPSGEELLQTLQQATARRDLGIDHLLKGRTALGIRDLTYALSLNPADPETLHWLGEAYRRKDRLTEAEDYLLRALELDPERHRTRLNLSGLYIQMEHFEQSIAEAQILIDDPLFSTPWQAHNNQGWAQLQLERVREARANFERALDYRHQYWPTHLNLGILEAREGQKLEAIEQFRAVLDSKVGGGVSAEASYRLGEVYVSLGRHDRAVKYFTAAVEESPHGRWGKQSEGYLKLLH